MQRLDNENINNSNVFNNMTRVSGELNFNQTQQNFLKNQLSTTNLSMRRKSSIKHNNNGMSVNQFLAQEQQEELAPADMKYRSIKQNPHHSFKVK